jgi:Domain of unknown function (DUF4129)
VRRVFLIIGVLAACVTPQMRADTPAPAPAPQAQNASLDDYRTHLSELYALTQKCAKGRDKASCDPQSIGQDDLVQWNAEQRIIRYDWLRALFLRAQEPDKTQQAAGALGKAELSNDSTLPTPRTTTQLLKDAEARLTRDLAQAGAPVETLPAHTAESNAMRQVLDGKEFRKLQQHTPQDSAFEKASEWLNKVFMGISSLTQGASWLGRALVWGFVLAVGIGLVWALLQLERRWRVRLVPDMDAPAPGAASARDWQLWLADAHKAAGAGLWREAIHFLYWAAISRLESKRLWPADRARTPREYLALVAPEDPRKAGLATLTGSFERVWYGGRPAGQTDYLRADELASALIGTSAAEGGQAR